MKVSISTIKAHKVYLFLCLEEGIRKEDFNLRVQQYVLQRWNSVTTNCFVETNDDTLAVVAILDVNQDHEAPQAEIDI